MDTKTINRFYFSRFIDSLEKDAEKWNMSHHGAYGNSWQEYHGPEYINAEGQRIAFAQTLNYLGCYVNGRILWQVPFWYQANIFSHQTRRFWKAWRKMKRLCHLKDTQELNDKLMKSL